VHHRRDVRGRRSRSDLRHDRGRVVFLVCDEETTMIKKVTRERAKEYAAIALRLLVSAAIVAAVLFYTCSTQ